MPDEASIDQQRTLVETLRDTCTGDGQAAQVIETHISWVLLTGEFAYKIKKAVDFGFLDYSTLALRRACCDEEVRLNRRTAPELYLDTVPIGGSPEQPLIGSGEPVEWAVKMRRFPQEALLDQRLARGLLDLVSMEEIARSLAEFHASVPAADADTSFGNPDAIFQPVADNFPALRQALGAMADHLKLERHAAWATHRFDALRPLFAARKAEGRVRECHGDLHLGNLIQWQGCVVPFDAIEFNPHLRWIDVANELAFIAMDLEARGRPDLSRHLVNAYLERTGDYGAVPLLDFYKHYRAMVRAKVTALRFAQTRADDRTRPLLMKDLGTYLTLATSYTQAATAAMVLTCGVTGSGKTRVAGGLIDRLPRTVRVRSDVERKRLFGLAADARSGSEVGGGLYTPDASQRTYARLQEVADRVTAAGYTVVVDATFLRRADREAFRALARARNIPWLILMVRAPEEVLRRRVTSRRVQGRDASEADLDVLAHQLATFEPLAAEEQPHAIQVDTNARYSADMLAQQVAKRLRPG